MIFSSFSRIILLRVSGQEFVFNMLIKKLSHEHKKLRENLVECQIKPNKISNLSILSAFRDVPREFFLPPSFYGMAYTEKNIQIAPQRFLLSPFQLAQLLNAAELKPQDKGLVVGFATGYSLAILTQIINETAGVECDEVLFDTAQDSLNQLGLCDLTLENDSLKKGLIEQAPYDVIVIEGAVHDVPPSLLEQLKSGGRLVCFKKIREKITQHFLTQAILITKTKEGYHTKTVFESTAEYLPGLTPNHSFSL